MASRDKGLHLVVVGAETFLAASVKGLRGGSLARKIDGRARAREAINLRWPGYVYIHTRERGSYITLRRPRVCRETRDSAVTIWDVHSSARARAFNFSARISSLISCRQFVPPEAPANESGR